MLISRFQSTLQSWYVSYLESIFNARHRSRSESTFATIFMDLLSIYYHPTPATQLRFQDYENISNILALHLQMITDLVDFFQN